MKIQITLAGTDHNQHSKNLMYLANLLGGTSTAYATSAATEAVEEKSHIDMGEMNKRTRRTKKEIEAAKAAEMEAAAPAEDEIDLGDEPAEEEEAKTLTLDGDIIPAFQAYAKNNSREAAGKVLLKYKVKSVRELPESKFAEVLKVLGA